MTTAAQVTPQDQAGDGLANIPVDALLAANPFVGLNLGQIVSAFGRVLIRLGLRPTVVARRSAALAADLAKVLAGREVVTPARGDKRWADAAWRENFAYRRLQQAYLAVSAALDQAIEEAGLDAKSEARGKFATAIIVEGLAPSNTPLNPSVVKRAFDTGGRSLLTGIRHAVSDIRGNHGMPRTVDRRPFVAGETIAVTPGAVVHRSPVLELIQYTPTTGRVREIPVVYVPPQINKYYVLDLAPGRSFVENALANGLQFFAVSYANPGKERRDLGLDAYVEAILEAIEAAREITGSESVHLMGLCAGGMTAAALLGHLAATGELGKVRSLSTLVSMLDTAHDSQLAALSSRRAIESSLKKADKQGVHSGSDMARLFAWLRPNDLVFNYVVNNWLLGQDPPAFDVLAWNADTTNLPAALYRDFIHLYEGNRLREPFGLTVLGTPIDLAKVDVDAYAVAGSTDHIVPWQAAWATTQILGGDVEFVLSNSGHIQSLVNPPGNPKASYFVGDSSLPDSESWLASVKQQKGSWWQHWVEWVTTRSGEEKPAPQAFGNAARPPIVPAPGVYVKQAAD